MRAKVSTGEAGLWAVDLATGEITKVIKVGDPFDVGGGDLRTPTDVQIYLDYNNGSPPYSGFLNDANQLAFTAKFTDGSSGVFLVNVPEPTTAAALAAATTPFLMSRRRRRGLRPEGPATPGAWRA